MKSGLLCFLLFAVPPLFAADPAQSERGRQLFFNSPRGFACATCHSLEGKGTAVGPDLTRLAAVVGPRGLVNTIQMTMTAYVQDIKLRNGRQFPGIQKQKEGDTIEIYDLSKFPATLLSLKSSDIDSMKTTSKWTHPPTTAGYTSEELADLVSYLKCAAGKPQDVSPADLK